MLNLDFRTSLSRDLLEDGGLICVVVVVLGGKVSVVVRVNVVVF